MDRKIIAARLKDGDRKIEVLPKYDSDNEEVTKEMRGHEIFPKRHSNILIIGSKTSGKTNLVYNIIKKTVEPETEVWFFVRTLHNDPSYKKIMDWLDKHNIYHEDHTEIDSLNDALELFKEDGKNDFHIDKIIVYDDISTEIEHNRDIESSVKEDRHYLAKNIIATHNYMELPKKARSNVDYLILFPRLSDSTLESIYKDLQFDINFKEFKKIYDDATKKKYNFLFIDLMDQRFYKNFDEEYTFTL